MQQFLVDNAAIIIELLGAAFLVIVAIIALTPRKDDDDALRGFLASLSPTAKKAIGGGALAGVLALVAALLGGCGHVPMPSPETAANVGHVLACKGCAAMGGDPGAACAAVLGCE
jgi:hypothetical protein